MQDVIISKYKSDKPFNHFSKLLPVCFSFSARHMPFFIVHETAEGVFHNQFWTLRKKHKEFIALILL